MSIKVVMLIIYGIKMNSVELELNHCGAHEIQKKYVLTEEERAYLKELIKEAELDDEEERKCWECLDCE